MIPYFPEHIFDGTWDGRANLSEVRPPTYGDYVRLSKELQATQEFILSKLQNLQGVPAATEKLQDICQTAKKIEKKLEKSIIPDELDAYIKSVETKLEELLEKVQKLQKALARTNIEYLSLQGRTEKIEKGWETDVSAFQRYNRGEHARFKESVQNSIDDLKKQLLSLRDILGS